MQDSLDLEGAGSVEDPSRPGDLRARLQEATSEKIRVMSQILELRVETEALLKSLRSRLDEVNRELESCRRGHQMHAHQLETRIGELDAQLSAAQARSAELDAQLSAVQARSAELDARLSAAQARSAELEAQLSAPEAPSAELEAQLSASEARSAEMQSAIEGLGPKINGLQEASSRLDELCSRIGSYRSVDS
jgi:chromosome segregation ATPase